MIAHQRCMLAIIAAFIVFPAYASAEARAINMQEGLWEMRFKPSMAGMTMPAISSQQCISKNDLVPQQNNTDDDECGPLDIQFNDSTVSWTVDCGQNLGSGKVTYHGNTLTGEMRVSSTVEGMSMEMTSTIEGKRMGDCEE